MNPFDLRGPQFLAFYIFVGILVTVIVSRLRRHADSTVTPPRTTGLLTDYLDIAFLRGGAYEAARVATLALLGRGWLDIVDGTKARVREGTTIDAAPEGTEHRLLAKYQQPTSPASVYFDRSLLRAIKETHEPSLVRRGLLPDRETRAARRTLFLWAALVMASIAATKIVVALGRGRTNIIFLIICAIAFLIALFVVTHPRRTPAGDGMLEDLERLFGDLKGRASDATSTADDREIALIAAVFGAHVAYATMPEARRLFGSGSTSGSDGSSSSVSSCGSSSSSCGGGGGGCGGCGGGGCGS